MEGESPTLTFERNLLLNRMIGGSKFHKIKLLLCCFNVNRFFLSPRNFNEVINMLRVGVPVNSQDKDGYSALYWAVFNDNTDVVDMLISKKADVNVRNSHYWTPLHAASHNSNTEMMKFLLQNGAEPSIRNIRGETALDIARTYLREVEIQQLLEK